MSWFLSRIGVLAGFTCNWSSVFARNLGQEPGSPLGLVDPYFDQAGGRDVVVRATGLMGRAKKPRQLLVVRLQLRQHLVGSNEVLIVVLQTLMPGDIADGPKRCSSKF